MVSSISYSESEARLVQRDRRQPAEPGERPWRPLHGRGSDSPSRRGWGAARCQLGVEAERRDRLGRHNHERPGPCIGVGGGPPRAGGEPRPSLFPGQDKDKGLLQTQADRDGSNDAGFLIRVLWGVELRVFGSTKRQSIGGAESVIYVS